MTSSKKNPPSQFTMLSVVLSGLRYGRGYKTSEICSWVGFTKQKMNYWLTKFCEEGLIRKQTHGVYEITDNGKRILDQYETYANKQLVRIENMHVTYHVISGISKLFEMIEWRASGLKNNRVYTSKIENHTVRLIKKHDGYNFQVYVTKVLDVNLCEAYRQARMEADYVASCTSKYGAEFSDGWVSSMPEIAIPSPIASALLETNNASHIRTNKGIMNRSKGRGADWEVTDLQQAQKIVDMPDTISRIEQRLVRIEDMLRLTAGSIEPITSSFYKRFF